MHTSIQFLILHTGEHPLAGHLATWPGRCVHLSFVAQSSCVGEEAVSNHSQRESYEPKRRLDVNRNVTEDRRKY